MYGNRFSNPAQAESFGRIGLGRSQAPPVYQPQRELATKLKSNPPKPVLNGSVTPATLQPQRPAELWKSSPTKQPLNGGVKPAVYRPQQQPVTQLKPNSTARALNRAATTATVIQRISDQYRNTIRQTLNYNPQGAGVAIPPNPVRPNWAPNLTQYVYNRAQQRTRQVTDLMYLCEGCNHWFPEEAMAIDHRVNWRTWAMGAGAHLRNGQGPALDLEDLRLLYNDPNNLTLRCTSCNSQDEHNNGNVLWLRTANRQNRIYHT